MANVLSNNPFIIDTPGAGVVLFPLHLKIRHFEFSEYLAAGDTVIVQDKNGKEIWAGHGAADLQEVRSGNIGWFEGLIVPTMTNAPTSKLKVYFE